jgi:hypothetical protein
MKVLSPWENKDVPMKEYFYKKKYLTTHLNRIYLSTARIPFMRDKNGRENFLPDYILVRDAAQCTVMDCL